VCSSDLCDPQQMTVIILRPVPRQTFLLKHLIESVTMQFFSFSKRAVNVKYQGFQHDSDFCKQAKFESNLFHSSDF